MNTVSRAGLTLVTGTCLALVASPAAAHGGAHHSHDIVEKGEWVATPAEFYAAAEFPACGDVITIVGGDVRAAEDRTSTLADGSTLVEFRGEVTVDLTRKSDGAKIDELDISGVGHTVISADGRYLHDVLFGASLLYPYTEADAALFREQFGTDLVYFADPDESVTLELTVDPATGALVEFRDVDVDAHLVDLCTVFDRKHHDGEHHDGRHHDGRHHDGKHHH